MPGYNPEAIEPRWQRFWEENKTFRTPDDSSRPKFYILDMFPYPSGAGLHVGHPEGYTATDILARYRRMCGDNVLHPMGWDAFGLPAEKHAVKTGTHPRVTTRQSIETFRRQHHVRRPEESIRTGREDPDALPRRHAEIDLGALTAADPVALQLLDPLGPINLFQPFQQALGVGGDTQHPLPQRHADDGMTFLF